jgi:hypothetical protein
VCLTAQKTCRHGGQVLESARKRTPQPEAGESIGCLQHSMELQYNNNPEERNQQLPCLNAYS